MSELIAIGDWRFNPDAAELRRGDERRALQDRAARVLHLLASREGGVVTHDELVAQVWNGRAVSPNSVAVVIGDLRRALGDDARAPKYIETVAKRGYRLRSAAEAAPAVNAGGLKRFQTPLVVAAVLAAMITASALLPRVSPLARAPIAVAEIRNETGDPAFDPLARAVRELVVIDTARAEHLHVVRGETEGAQIVLSGRLVMWSGHPSVSLNAVEPRTGRVLWSAMAPGPEDALPGQVRAHMDEFIASVEPGAAP